MQEQEFELKATAGIERNMTEEIKNLRRKAYAAGHKDGYIEGRNASLDTETCSWEKGVKDSIEFLALTAYELSEDSEVQDNIREAFDAIGAIFEELDLLKMVRDFNKARALDEALGGEQYVPEVGDIVLDASDNRCTVTNTDTHIHVVYENGKTHKWRKCDKFKKVGKAPVMSVEIDED